MLQVPGSFTERKKMTPAWGEGGGAWDLYLKTVGLRTEGKAHLSGLGYVQTPARLEPHTASHSASETWPRELRTEVFTQSHSLGVLRDLVTAGWSFSHSQTTKQPFQPCGT